MSKLSQIFSTLQNPLILPFQGKAAIHVPPMGSSAPMDTETAEQVKALYPQMFDGSSPSLIVMAIADVEAEPAKVSKPTTVADTAGPIPVNGPDSPQAVRAAERSEKEAEAAAAAAAREAPTTRPSRHK